MVSTFKRNIVLGLGISLATLIISSVASYISIQKLVESDFWVDHTFASLLAVIITYVFYRRMRTNLDDTQKLQDQLEKKEQDTEKHIKVISELAEQISKGNYDIRVKDSDLK